MIMDNLGMKEEKMIISSQLLKEKRGMKKKKAQGPTGGHGFHDLCLNRETAVLHSLALKIF